MARKKAQILPQAHLGETDTRDGGRERGASHSEGVVREVRRRLLEILNRDAPAWNPADHPDIEEAGGAAAWVRQLPGGQGIKAALREVEETARSEQKLMPAILEAVKAYATVGEISDALRKVFGECQEPAVISRAKGVRYDLLKLNRAMPATGESLGPEGASRG